MNGSTLCRSASVFIRYDEDRSRLLQHLIIRALLAGVSMGCSNYYKSVTLVGLLREQARWPTLQVDILSRHHCCNADTVFVLHTLYGENTAFTLHCVHKYVHTLVDTTVFRFGTGPVYLCVCVCVSSCLVALAGVGSGVGRGARVNDTVS